MLLIIEVYVGALSKNAPGSGVGDSISTPEVGGRTTYSQDQHY